MPRKDWPVSISTSRDARNWDTEEPTGPYPVPTLLKQKGYEELDRIGEGAFGRAILAGAPRHGKSGEAMVQNQDGAKMVSVQARGREPSIFQVLYSHKGRFLTGIKSVPERYIVRYRDSFTEAGWFALLMDFCEGGDLTKRIDQARRRRQPIAEDQVLKWFTQATLALKYIHERHILHRDLKPGNFFLTKNGTPLVSVLKMGDFGQPDAFLVDDNVLRPAMLDRCSDDDVEEEEEEEIDDDNYDYAWPSDIWALGCILYELCALKVAELKPRVPFEGKNIHHLVQRIITGQAFGAWWLLRMRAAARGPETLCEEMLDRNPGFEQLSTNPSKAPTFKKGDYVEYHSDWLPAKVIKEEPGGKGVIDALQFKAHGNLAFVKKLLRNFRSDAKDLKPNTWMSPEDCSWGLIGIFGAHDMGEQLQKLRHRKEPPKLIDRSSAYPRSESLSVQVLTFSGSGSTPAIAGPTRADGAGALNGALPSVPRRSGSVGPPPELLHQQAFKALRYFAVRLLLERVSVPGACSAESPADVAWKGGLPHDSWAMGDGFT
ncbi:Serine/threonine-protein kinase Nek1 [Symbiodinium microadriaticum]|uniref:non-specific serine/threonine protein kinase n=1 Tax=Symbiodinium microadriaticum TaxID=2951 RepID=A0A1Q9CZV5_SYMMI|nr:Serine/threonine-protein kinase Nek1 [Symbiodinium microadriaticum]